MAGKFNYGVYKDPEVFAKDHCRIEQYHHFLFVVEPEKQPCYDKDGGIHLELPLKSYLVPCGSEIKGIDFSDIRK